MRITIETQQFSPWNVLAEYEQILHQMHHGRYGASAVFVGTMRDFNDGDEVDGMMLEHYPGMTERELARIAEEAKEKWPLVAGLIHHRVGRIRPGEAIVLVGVWSAHRGAAFDASRYIMEALKSRAPFWKKELQEGRDGRWVQNNTDGYTP